MSRTDAPGRILLVRTSALGDLVHALPVLAALKRAWPRAEIAWVVDEDLAPLLAGHESLDLLIRAPLRRWRRGGRGRAGELARFVRELRSFRPDVAIDLMGSHKGGLIARLSGAPRRIGARRRNRREPSSAVWLNELVPVAAGHAVDRGLALLSALAIAPTPADFAPEGLACGRGVEGPTGHIFLHPGAAWGNKRYPAERWGRVAALLAAQLGGEVLVGAAPGEERLADEAVTASAGAARRHDAPDLDHLCAALRGARLVLAGDTGALHLAHALGVPVVAVHGPTDPVLHGPYGAPHRAVAHRLACSFCHRRMGDAKACLLGIAPEEIAALGRAAVAV